MTIDWTHDAATNDRLRLARMRELFGADLRRSDIHNLCLHKIGTGYPRCPYPVLRCPAGMGGDSSVYDHVEFWKTPDGMRFATSEPYAERLDGESLAEVINTADAMDLKVLQSDRSPYYPGRTKLIVIAPKSYAWPDGI
jgi:hypothetical protein